MKDKKETVKRNNKSVKWKKEKQIERKENIENKV